MAILDNDVIPVIRFFCRLVLRFDHCSAVSWLYSFTSSVSLTGSYPDVEPK